VASQKPFVKKRLQSRDTRCSRTHLQGASMQEMELPFTPDTQLA